MIPIGYVNYGDYAYIYTNKCLLGLKLWIPRLTVRIGKGLSDDSIGQAGLLETKCPQSFRQKYHGWTMKLHTDTVKSDPGSRSGLQNELLIQD
jgi:hypothetical protein